MLTEFDDDLLNPLGGVHQILQHAFFKQPIKVNFLLGWLMTMSVKVVWLDQIYKCMKFG